MAARTTVAVPVGRGLRLELEPGSDELRSPVRLVSGDHTTAAARWCVNLPRTYRVNVIRKIMKLTVTARVLWPCEVGIACSGVLSVT